MPQVKRVRSLLKSCLVFVSENMERFCSNESDGQKDGVDCNDLEKFTTNPFDQLPSVLLEAIIKRIVKKERTKQFLPHLITKNLSSLIVVNVEVNFHEIVRLATIRCKHLKTLKLRNTRPQNYRLNCLYLIPQFSHLQTLNISKHVTVRFTPYDIDIIPHFDLTTDDLFHLLGIHCTKLRELRVRNISDVGIKGLCVIGNCKSISFLDIRGSPAVTSEGIQMAVDNLPSLKWLIHESLIDGLARIAQSAPNQRLANLPQYSLSALSLDINSVSSVSVYREGSLGKSVLLCPYVTEIRVLSVAKGLKNSDLLSLLSLNKLYILSINLFLSEPKSLMNPYELCIDEDLTFHGGVLPLLKRFGNSLKKLKLQGCFFDIDISDVIEFCPKLDTLVLLQLMYNFRLWRTERIPLSTVPVLRNLERLEISRPPDHPFVSSENLLKLLSSPLLREVRLENVDTLTDKILETANNLHFFRHLKFLYIEDCRSVTKRGIDLFMQENNPLKEIDLSNYQDDTLENRIEWKMKSIEKNWKLLFS